MGPFNGWNSGFGCCDTPKIGERKKQRWYEANKDEKNTKDDLGMTSWKLGLHGPKGSDQSKAWLVDFVVYL